MDVQCLDRPDSVRPAPVARPDRRRGARAGCARPDRLDRRRHSRKLLADILKLAQDLREHSRRIVCCAHRAESGNRIRVVEIPLVFRDADEIADGGIASPGAAQRRAGQLGRDAGSQECADIGIGGDRFNRRQARRDQTALRVAASLWRWRRRLSGIRRRFRFPRHFLTRASIAPIAGMTLSRSVTARSRSFCSGKRLLIALALDEGTVDMMLGRRSCR